MAALFIVSTPIGNLGDLTPRAGEVLGSVARILAEDTRRTRKLLSHLGLDTPLVSLHAHNESARAAAVLGWLQEGQDLALVSDAGTPLISDPGQRIVTAVLEAGHPVVPVPGPSAVLAALVASGFGGDRFSFLGFLPRKGRQRSELLERVADAPEPVVLFESPERLLALLDALGTVCGPTRRVSVAREITKLHETFVRGTLAEVRDHFQQEKPRGEVVVVVSAAEEAQGMDSVDEAAGASLARALLHGGLTPSRAAREVARRLRIPRNVAYRIVQDLAAGSQAAGDGP